MLLLFVPVPFTTIHVC